MLPGPAVPGCCLVYFHFLCNIHSIHSVQGGPTGFTPEIEVFHMLFEWCHPKNRKWSIEQHTRYFNFRSKMQLDRPVECKDNNQLIHVHLFGFSVIMVINITLAQTHCEWRESREQDVIFALCSRNHISLSEGGGDHFCLRCSTPQAYKPSFYRHHHLQSSKSLIID